MGSMRNWLKYEDMDGKSGGVKDGKKRVVVVHCKAGKGRSGTVSCSYLISEEGWKMEDALKRFTERRMRPGFGAGVSIPSQLRWVGYVDRWTKGGKIYTERPVEVLEVHVWGLRDGVKVAVQGYVDEGKTIKAFHTFSKQERIVVKNDIKKSNPGFADVVSEAMKAKDNVTKGQAPLEPSVVEEAAREAQKVPRPSEGLNPGTGGDIVFRPSNPIILETNDINIDFERRNKASYGFSMVTSVAHVWFNTFFEGRGPEQNGTADDNGVFEIEWDAMDGIKGSARKGTRAFDKMAVVWKSAAKERQHSVVIMEPKAGEEVRQTQPADWRGNDQFEPSLGRDLGIRASTPHSAHISRASSLRSEKGRTSADSDDERKAVKPFGVDGQTDGGPSKTLLPTSKDLPGPTHGNEREGKGSA